MNLTISIDYIVAVIDYQQKRFIPKIWQEVIE